MNNWKEKSEVDFHDLGTVLTLSGLLFQGGDQTVKVLFPDADSEDGFIPLTRDEFKAFVRQLDHQEMEIYRNDRNLKAFVRKTQRQLDPLIVWQVFARDNYTCRYCGRNNSNTSGGLQLTYDHIKLWEDGGETSLENGVCACKRCNNKRGRTDYEQWIKGPQYAEYYMQGLLDVEIHNLNVELISKYRNFPTRASRRSR